VSEPKFARRNAGPDVLCIVVLQATPLLAFGQASPFDTGADSLLTWALGIAMPIAALFIIGLGIAALVGRISWGLAVGCIVGIALIFGAPQIVTWMRGMFGV
jgi:type IV secretion system protein VirB2